MARIIGELNQRFPSLEYVVEDLDVDFDQELNSLYSDEVPVLLIDGEQVAFHRLDAQRILGIVESKL